MVADNDRGRQSKPSTVSRDFNKLKKSILLSSVNDVPPLEICKQFVEKILLERTTSPIWISSIANGRGDEKHVHTRDVSKILDFVKKWDKPGRSVYFCVSSILEGRSRKKENTGERIFRWHVDIDVATPDIFEAVKKLNPSLVVASGRGYHVYWLEDSVPPWSDEEESTLKILTAKIGGDPTQAHRVAFLRPPGTRNRKRDSDGVEVRVVYQSDEYCTTYEWPSLVEPKKTDPWTAVGEQFSFKPPLDVEEALREMQYLGEGRGGNVHDTQLRVTASLTSHGVDPDEIIEVVLAATRAAVGDDASWNWRKEEEIIRKMCEDAQTKGFHERAEEEKIVNLGQKRQEKEQKKEKISQAVNKKLKPHVMLGTGFLAALEAGGQAILYVDEVLWYYRDGLWRVVKDENRFINEHLQTGCNYLGLVPKNHLISEARNWIQRNADIRCERVPWDGHGKILTMTGFTDGTEATKDDYATFRVCADYDPQAACPMFLRLLKDCFRTNPDVVPLIQEVLGMALVRSKPRSLMRILLFVGPANSGKSTILNVLTGILCESKEDVNATPLELLENPHGLMAFLRSGPWILHEAFEQNKFHFSALVKAIAAGDPVNVNKKNGPLVTIVPRQASIWATNYPPQFKESTRAMEQRFMIISCHEEFDPDKPVGLAKKYGDVKLDEVILAEERSGILNWLLEGLKRAQDRRYFLMPEEVKKNLHEMRLRSNLVLGFFEECVDYDETSGVWMTDFCGAVIGWWWEHYGNENFAPSNEAIGVALTALGDTRVGRTKVEGHRVVTGIKLNPLGIEFWQEFKGSDFVLRKGGGGRTSTGPMLVNRQLNHPGSTL